jgi:formylglycine-generating enzyme required for sulfatase activity
MGATASDLEHYVDFKWFTIFYYPYYISPNPLLGSPGHEYKLTAKSKGKPFYFGDPKYVWTFGDNTAQVTVLNDSTVTHTYAAEGNYTVKVELFDHKSYEDKKQSEAVSSAQIRAADPTMVKVTGGTFQMGNAFDLLDKEGRPIHTVTVSSFLIDKYEITYEKWTEVRNWALNHGYASIDIAEGQNGFGFSNPTTSKVNNPVTVVNWYDILKWCNARSEMDGLNPVYYTNSKLDIVYRSGQIQYYPQNAVNWAANGYRLPTEAEWEFAARGGTKSGNFKYSGSNTIGDVTWFAGNSGSSPLIELTTHPVGQKTPNELGIYDMSGNALEWCWDLRGDYPSTAQIDPKGPPGGGTNVLRGGGFNMDPGLCESANRHMQYPPNTHTFPGFRCAAD